MLKKKTAGAAIAGACSVVAVTLFLLSSYGRTSAANPESPLPANRFRLTVKNLISDSEMKGTQVYIEKLGTGTMQVDAAIKNNGFVQNNISLAPPPAEGSQRSSDALSHAELIIFSDTITTPDKANDQVKLLIQTSSGGSRSIGKAIWSVSGAAKLRESFALSVQTGIYQIGTPLKLGTLQGEAVTLTVQ